VQNPEAAGPVADTKVADTVNDALLVPALLQAAPPIKTATAAKRTRRFARLAPVAGNFMFDAPGCPLPGRCLEADGQGAYMRRCRCYCVGTRLRRHRTSHRQNAVIRILAIKPRSSIWCVTCRDGTERSAERIIQTVRQYTSAGRCSASRSAIPSTITTTTTDAQGWSIIERCSRGRQGSSTFHGCSIRLVSRCDECRNRPECQRPGKCADSTSRGESSAYRKGRRGCGIRGRYQYDDGGAAD
jgi:hypothetical protein